MYVNFHGKLKEVRDREVSKKHILLYIDCDYIKDIIRKYAKPGTIPIHEGLVVVRTSFQINLLKQFLNKDVNITANYYSFDNINILNLVDINDKEIVAKIV
jgi:hypothetical protein